MKNIILLFALLGCGEAERAPHLTTLSPPAQLEDSGGVDYDAGPRPFDAGNSLTTDSGQLETDSGIVDGGVSPDASLDGGGEDCMLMGECPNLNLPTPSRGFIISEVLPGVQFELYNNSGESILLSRSSRRVCTHRGCITILEGGTVNPGEYVSFAWSPELGDLSGLHGELFIYHQTDTRMSDYVCWGTTVETNYAIAVSDGVWSGPCVTRFTESLHRSSCTDGTLSTDYYSGPSNFLTCGM